MKRLSPTQWGAPMMADIRFNNLIPINLSAPQPFPAWIKTVEQAIDCVQELPLVILEQDR